MQVILPTEQVQEIQSMIVNLHNLRFLISMKIWD